MFKSQSPELITLTWRKVQGVHICMYLNVSSRTDSKQPSLSDSLCVSSSSLHSRLQQLQSRFTWDLKEEDMDLENLSIRLQEHIDLQLGQQSAVALSYSFLAYVRYSKASPGSVWSLATCLAMTLPCSTRGKRGKTDIWASLLKVSLSTICKKCSTKEKNRAKQRGVLIQKPQLIYKNRMWQHILWSIADLCPCRQTMISHPLTGLLSIWQQIWCTWTQKIFYMSPIFVNAFS